MSGDQLIAQQGNHRIGEIAGNLAMRRYQVVALDSEAQTYGHELDISGCLDLFDHLQEMVVEIVPSICLKRGIVSGCSVLEHASCAAR